MVEGMEIESIAFISAGMEVYAVTGYANALTPSDLSQLLNRAGYV